MILKIWRNQSNELPLHGKFKSSRFLQLREVEHFKKGGHSNRLSLF